jgi:hypothetical protein
LGSLCTSFAVRFESPFSRTPAIHVTGIAVRVGLEQDQPPLTPACRIGGGALKKRIPTGKNWFGVQTKS